MSILAVIAAVRGSKIQWTYILMRMGIRAVAPPSLFPFWCKRRGVYCVATLRSMTTIKQIKTYDTRLWFFLSKSFSGMVPETLSLLFSHHNHYNAWKSLVLGLNHVHSTVFARVLASKWTMYTPDVIIYLTCASLCNRIWRRKKKMIWCQ
jgi:hypothetical protein